MRISIDGNIGSGKSTVMSMLEKNLDKDKYCFIQEDVKNWDNYLKQYYNDIKQNSLLFQMKVLLHHLTNKNIGNKIQIHERSPLSCIDIFGINLKNSKFLTELDIDLMKNYNSIYGWLPDLVIYIKTEPDIAHNRIKKRSRQGESIPLTYLNNINNLYNNLYTRGSENIKVICVNGNLDINIIVNQITTIIENL